jgi:hypothetical protein
MCEMNQPDNRMPDVMRRLNAMAPQGASPALGDLLKDEFQRHYARRRRIQTVRISLLAACLVAAVALSIILSRPRAANRLVVHEPPQSAPASESISADPIEPAVSKPAIKKAHAPAKSRNNPPAEADRFVALPTFDPAIPIDHLEMVRLDLPGRALQLVGYPVSEEIAERRVVADVLLAQDGTPYALRLVRSSETKEQ